MKSSRSKILHNTFYAQFSVFVLSSLTSSIGHLIDGTVIGQCLGVDSMAAFGIINPMMITFSLSGAIVASGARTRFTKLIGAGKIKEAQAMFSLSCILSIGMAAALMLILLPVAEPFTKMLGASGNAAALLPKAKGYLIGVLLGLPGMNAVRILNAYMPIDNDRKLPMISAIVLTVTNTILDLLVVFVIHGDTFEMAIATSISYYVSVLVLLTHFRRKNIILHFSFRKILWKETGAILLKGIPIGICRIGNTIRCAYMNHLLSIIAASSAIAAYSVHRQADSFLNPLTLGMADTVAILAGILIGEENRPGIKDLLSTSFRAVIKITLGASLLSWIFAPQFASLYIKNDPEALRLSIRAVRCYAAGMPLYGINIIYQNYFLGIGKTRMSAVSGFLMESGFLMLSAFCLSHWIGADAVWFAFPATQSLMIIFYSVIVIFQNKKIHQGESSFWDKVIFLPTSFDVPAEDRIEMTITTMDEVTHLSQAVWDFCTAHGCEARKRYLMSLSVEEMAGNVIKHGFSKDKQKHSIDIRILKKGDDYILRIRDDCMIFDPVEQLSLYSGEDRSHHFGLRLIIGLARDVQYTCILKLNNLLIRI